MGISALVALSCLLLTVLQLRAQSVSGHIAGAELEVVGVESNDTLNLRAQPGVRAKIAAKLPPGATGLVATGKHVNLGGTSWIEVKYRGRKGWVNAHYVMAVGPSPVKPVSGAKAIAHKAANERGYGKRVALVIGNGRYLGTSPLKNPTNDARAIADALKRIGFERVALHLDVTQKQLTDAIAKFVASVGDAKLALIYFAGHGLQIDGASYLLPTDAKLEKAEDIASHAIELGTLLRRLDSTTALKLVIVDACRDNPFRVRLAEAEAALSRSTGYVGKSIGRGLGRVASAGHDTLVAYAARDGSLAFDGDGRNSPFAAAILNQLDVPGTEVGLMFRRVRDHVLAATGRKQEPYTYGSIGGEEVYLWPLEGGLLLGNDVSDRDEGLSKLRQQTDPLVAALKSANLRALSAYVHPTSGLLVYGVTMHRKDLANPAFGARIFKWAASDESGETPTASVSAYLRGLYKSDYLRAAVVSFNDRHRANMETAPLALIRRPGAVFVDYHVKSATEYGTDWTTLRLILEKANDRWFLVEIESLTADP
jgi:hypothetical protein